MNRAKSLRCYTVVLTLCWGMAQTVLAGDASSAGSAPVAASTHHDEEQIFARVNGKPILQRDFDVRLYNLVRQRFYHGMPEGGDQEEAVRKEVADFLIDFELLVEEAKKRGIKPEEEKIEKAAATADERFASNQEWQDVREEVLPKIREQAARHSLYEQIEQKIKDVPNPAPAEARAFYEKNLDLFTEPVKLSMSLIVQRVDPSAPKEDWTYARDEMKKIIARVKEGADFAELARQYSQDKSASNGGSLGYVHAGMLNEHLQKEIDSFKPGEMTEPTTILEGIGVYRLDERIPSKLREFADVEQRATDLLQRELVDQSWKGTIGNLRAAAKIEILGSKEIEKANASKQKAGTKQGGSSKEKNNTK